MGAAPALAVIAVVYATALGVVRVWGAAGLVHRPWWLVLVTCGTGVLLLWVGLGSRDGRRHPERFLPGTLFVLGFLVSWWLSRWDATGSGPSVAGVGRVAGPALVVAGMSAYVAVGFGSTGNRLIEEIPRLLTVLAIAESSMVVVEFIAWHLGYEEWVLMLPWKCAVFRLHDGRDFLAGTIRATGTFGNPNTTGGFLVLLLGIVLGGCAGYGTRWLRGVGVLLVVLAIGFTYSRAAYLGGIVTIVGFLVLVRRVGTRRMWLGGLLLGVLSIGFCSRWMTLRVLSQPAIQSRLAIWGVALRMWWARPVLGVGPGSFASHYLARHRIDWIAYRFPDAHSGWFTILAEQGLWGVVSLAACFIPVWHVMRHRVAGMPDDAIGAGCGLMGFGVCVVFDNLFVEEAVVWLTWALVGYCVLAARASSRCETASRSAMDRRDLPMERPGALPGGGGEPSG